MGYDMNKFDEAFEKAVEEAKKNTNIDKWVIYPEFVVTPTPSNCLHDACPECHGTGRKSDGSTCVHFISCPCPKCNLLVNI